MPKLRCGVQTCLHNANDFCCMQAINVSGKAAHASSQTCCNTFCDNQGSMTNAAMNVAPNTEVSVECNADHCVHNQNHICHADSIDVNGYTASAAEETECASFYCR